MGNARKAETVSQLKWIVRRLRNCKTDVQRTRNEMNDVNAAKLSGIQPAIEATQLLLEDAIARLEIAWDERSCRTIERSTPLLDCDYSPTDD